MIIFIGNANLPFMRLNLLFALVMLCLSAKSQTAEINLKDFINKNHLALRSVHKHLIHQGNSSYEPTFRELLKKQENAVKSVNDKSSSLSFAYAVRTECLDFLKKNSKGSTEYFELSPAEQKASEHLSVPASNLTKSENELIDKLNLKDSQSLNQLPLTIQ